MTTPHPTIGLSVTVDELGALIATVYDLDPSEQLIAYGIGDCPLLACADVAPVALAWAPLVLTNDHIIEWVGVGDRLTLAVPRDREHRAVLARYLRRRACTELRTYGEQARIGGIPAIDAVALALRVDDAARLPHEPADHTAVIRAIARQHDVEIPRAARHLQIAA